MLPPGGRGREPLLRSTTPASSAPARLRACVPRARERGRVDMRASIITTRQATRAAVGVRMRSRARSRLRVHARRRRQPKWTGVGMLISQPPAQPGKGEVEAGLPERAPLPPSRTDALITTQPTPPGDCDLDLRAHCFGRPRESAGTSWGEPTERSQPAGLACQLGWQASGPPPRPRGRGARRARELPPT